MSLNSNKYLKALDSEKRVPAVFQSLSVQQQLDHMREDIRLLYDAVDKLISIVDPEQQQSITLPKLDLEHSPYI